MSNKTKETYNLISKEYDEKTKDYTIQYLKDDLDLFFKNIKGDKILDIGCGPGRDLQIFKEHGYKAVGIDNSRSMIEICKSKKLNVIEMDILNIQFENNSFNAIWAYTSLLHIPKNKFANVLNTIHNLLKEDGIFYIGMKEGDFEGYKTYAHTDELERFFSLYTKEELEKILKKKFKIINYSKVSIDNNHYINFLCKKK